MILLDIFSNFLKKRKKHTRRCASVTVYSFVATIKATNNYPAATQRTEKPS